MRKEDPNGVKCEGSSIEKGETYPHADCAVLRTGANVAIIDSDAMNHMLMSTQREYTRAGANVPDAYLLTSVRGGQKILVQFEAVDNASVLLV